MDDTTETTAPSPPTLAEEVNELSVAAKNIKPDPEALKKAADAAVNMRKRACRLNIAVELRGVTYPAGKDLVLKTFQIEHFKDSLIEIDGVAVDPKKAEEINIVPNEPNE